jgi:hypothetical protein
MTDLIKLQKLLNLSLSENASEALAALRLAQALTKIHLGDFMMSLAQGSLETNREASSENPFNAESQRVDSLQLRSDQLTKDLRKAERDKIRLTRENKDLRSRLADVQKELSLVAERDARKSAPGAYETLEKLYETQVEANENLKVQLSQKDRFVKKGMRDLSKLKRGRGSEENRVEELEKMVNDLSLELMDYKDRERVRGRGLNP